MEKLSNWYFRVSKTHPAQTALATVIVAGVCGISGYFSWDIPTVGPVVTVCFAILSAAAVVGLANMMMARFMDYVDDVILPDD